MNLARYSLRLAWLYRDVSENPLLKDTIDKKLPKLISIISKKWPEIPGNEKQALKMALKYYQISLEKSYTVKSSLDEITIILLIIRIYIAIEENHSANA